MKAVEEFVVGKHQIGYVDSDFKSRFGKDEFEMKEAPTKFQKLPRYMTDAEIESELKPGICDLGDVLAFIENAPKEYKDGNWNLFYTKNFVVCVFWNGFFGEWYVGTWSRGGGGWGVDSRVFSPAAGSLETKSSDLGDFVPRAEFEEFKKKVVKILNLN